MIRRSKYLIALGAALLCSANTLPAAQSLGITNTFGTLPPAADWSTLSVGSSAGTYASAAALDTAVIANTAASSITAQLGTSATQPPSPNAISRFNTAGLYLQTRPTGNDYTVLMVTLVNDSGSSVASVPVSYDWQQRNTVPVGENIPGHRAYWSTTGAAGSWTLIPEFSTFTVNDAGPTNLFANIPVALADGAKLYLIWADDNGPGSTTDPQEGSYTIDNFIAGTPLPEEPPTITTNPPAEITLLQSRSTNLVVAARGIQPFTYQWFRNETPIGTNGPILGIANAQFGVDEGDYYCVVSNAFGGTPSTHCIVTLTGDETPPLALWADGNESFTRITIRYSEPVDSLTGPDPWNYTLSSGVGFAAAALSADGVTVVLTPEYRLEENTDYTVTINGVEDLAGNVIAQDTTVSFRSYALVQGFLNFAVYTNIAGTTVADLTGSTNFPDNPGERYWVTAFDTRRAYPNNSHDNYGGRLSGVFIPPASGPWVFYLRSDNAAQLYLTQDGTDPLSKTLIAQELTYGYAFSVNASGPQTLTAGQPYYIEALYKESTGADYCQVAAKLESDPTPPDSLPPIPASQLGCYVNTNQAVVSISLQPTNQMAIDPENAPAVATEDFTTSNGGFTVISVNNPGKPWAYASGAWSASDRTDCGTVAFRNSQLSSPYYSVPTAGSLTLSFTHQYAWEADSAALWDGGQLRISINGGPYVAVAGSSFTAGGYTGIVGPVPGGADMPNSDLAGQEAFTSASGGGITSTAALGTFGPSDVVSVQFFAAWDDCSEGAEPNWLIDSIQFSPAVENRTSQAAVTFTVQATAASPGSSNLPVFYQWQRNNGSGFVDIPSANSASYSLRPALRDNGAQFRCLVQTPGASTASAAATLTVTGSAPAPRLAMTLASGNVEITWPAPSTGFVLEQTAALLTPSTTVWTPEGSTPQVANGMNKVTITPGATPRFYRLRKP